MADEPLTTPQEPTTPTPETPPPSPPQDPAPPDDTPKPSLLEGPKADEPPKEPIAAPPELAKIEELKVPEGVTLREGALDELGPLIKEHNLSQPVAQALLDKHVAALKETQAASYKAWNDLRDGWVSEVKADKELGGDNQEKVLATVAKALDQYGDPEVRKVLSFTGAGDNPAIIRTLYRMSKALTEGGHVAGSPPKPPAGKGPHALYPDLA